MTLNHFARPPNPIGAWAACSGAGEAGGAEASLQQPWRCEGRGELSALMTLFLKGPASTLKRQIPIKPRKKWEQPEDEWGGKEGGREAAVAESPWATYPPRCG